MLLIALIARREFMKISFLLDGPIDANRGTPIRARKIMQSLLQSGVEVYCTTSSQLSDLQDFPNYHRIELEDNSFISGDFFVINLNGLWENRNRLKGHSGIIICDLHSLRSIETMGDSFKYAFKSFLIEIWAYFFIRRNRVHCIGVNKNLVRFFGSKRVENVWFPAATITENEFQVCNKNEKKILFYSGNSRKYQGVEFLIESFRESQIQEEFKLVICSSDEFIKNKYSFHPCIEFYIDLTPETTAQLCAKADIAVVPRQKTLNTLLTFPSKTLEYLAMGPTVVISDAVPELPGTLEKFVIRYESKNSNELITAIQRAASKIPGHDTIRIEQMETISLHWSYTKLAARLQKLMRTSQ
jgi:glycosyltransferase involved in cell wall biosynthesis